LFTFLNIIGLAIGISACWIVFRIVNYEFSLGTFSDYFSIVPYTWLAGNKNSVFKLPYAIFPHYVLPLL